jgi:hypothetical protein
MAQRRHLTEPLFLPLALALAEQLCFGWPQGHHIDGNLEMLPRYEDPWFTFRFAEARIILRFHLEGVEAGRRVSIFQMDPGANQRQCKLATATVGEGGWVVLLEPIIVRAGEAFVAVPEPGPR